MAKFKVIKLKNLTPIHIGTGKGSYDFSADDLKSDTISSALAAIRIQYGKSENTEEFLNSFSLSSAFPYYKNKFFLPKMHGKVNLVVNNEEEYSYRKKLKRIKYIELPLWEELIQGKMVTVTDDQIRDEFAVANSGFDKVAVSHVSQRVAVPRGDAADAEPFFFEWKFFDSSSGLFVLLDCDNHLFEEIVDLFVLLGQQGLGTDKSVGGGKFDVDVTEIELPDISKPTHEMLLSMYMPEYEELSQIDLRKSRYELQLRGGFMAGSSNVGFRHLRKKSIYMFNTGTLLVTQPRLKGRIVDLRPEWNDSLMHPVFRSGRPFCVSVKIEDYE